MARCDAEMSRETRDTKTLQSWRLTITFRCSDDGLYHCVATRSYGNSYAYNSYNRRDRETVYMEVDLDTRWGHIVVKIQPYREIQPSYQVQLRIREWILQRQRLWWILLQLRQIQPEAVLRLLQEDQGHRCHRQQSGREGAEQEKQLNCYFVSRTIREINLITVKHI